MSEFAAYTPLVALDVVVFDCETTGLDARTARIIQLGAVRVVGGEIRLGETFERLVNPGLPIPPETTAIHGLSDADVKDASAFAEVDGDLYAFIGARVVVGHTISFDMAMLESEARRCDRSAPQLQTLDVRALAEIAFPGLAQYDLDRIAAVLAVTIDGRHTAIGDAIATARIFVALLPHLRQRGVRSLADVDQALRNLADRQGPSGLQSVALTDAASDRVQALSRIDSFPYRHRVQDLMSAPAVWCLPATTVASALQQLVDQRISSVMIDGGATGIGIATERDLIRALNSHGAEALGRPVGDFASKPLQTIPADAFVYRAIGRLERLGLRHLAVTDDAGVIVGMVTTRNLLRHRATTAIALGDEIDAAAGPAELAMVWPKLARVARSLLDEGVDARLVANIASVELCALTRRAAEIAEQRLRDLGLGAAPCRFAVLVLGSGGRGESLLAADQDNAIVYEAGDAGGPEDQWFEQFAIQLNEILDTVGVPFCKGGVMAKNGVWRHSVDGWLALAERWVQRQRPEDLLNVDIFFDAIVVHGDAALGDDVLDRVYALASRARDFQMQLTELARRWSAPLTLFGNIKVDQDGRVDLKKHGILPIFTAARVMAIKAGVRVRGTPARLRSSAEGEVARADVETLIDAHQTLMRAMLEQQLLDIAAGKPANPRVDVDRLSQDSRATLKAAIKSVGLAPALVGEGRL